MKKVGELVGSVCLDNGKPRVTEYSELGAELAEKKTADGRYLFGDGSIANHLFTMEFLESFVFLFSLEEKLVSGSALPHSICHIIGLIRRLLTWIIMENL